MTQTQFLIASSIILAFIFPLFIYREKVLRFFGIISEDFIGFEIHLKTFLHENYPNIKFDFSIIDKLSKEPNTLTKEILIVENLASQFCSPEIKIKNSPNLEHSAFWPNYIQNSKPIKDKLPPDWNRRVELLSKLVGSKCQRCGIVAKPDASYLNLRKPISDGGGYNLENLIYCCTDCHRIINAKDSQKIAKDTNFFEKLKKFTTN